MDDRLTIVRRTSSRERKRTENYSRPTQHQRPHPHAPHPRQRRDRPQCDRHLKERHRPSGMAQKFLYHLNRDAEVQRRYRVGGEVRTSLLADYELTRR